MPRRWQAVLSQDDVLQQMYTDAFLHIDKFEARNGASFAAWLCTIADHNLANAVQMLEAEKRGGNHHPVTLRSRDESLSQLYERVASTKSTPSRQLARDEQRRALEQAIAKLPQRYRQVVQLFDLEGRSAAEIAAQLGCSRGAVYMIRARALRFLGELLGSASDFLST